MQNDGTGEKRAADLTEVSAEGASVVGFRAAAVDAGLYAFFGKPTRPDLALVAADRACTAAGVFTSNQVKAAPVLFDQIRLLANPERIRGVLINTASANACTGAEGRRNAELSAAWAAEALGCTAQEVLLMSTGVIGTQLPMPAMRAGIQAAVATLRPDGWPDAARAILTTDTRPKLTSLRGDGFSLIGMAKGAGMIAPNMATLLGLIVTDAAVAPTLLQSALAEAVAISFNRIVVDGDMSTNDTLLVLASGASGVQIGAANQGEFRALLRALCTKLATEIVRDAEGATKLITLHVTGARSEAEARQVGNAVATSPLVKTAFYGGDANWGRILAAAGRAGVEIEAGRLSLWYEQLRLVADGTPLPYDEVEASRIAGQPRIAVRLDLGLGDASVTLWTCDLSHDYVSINGHYRT